MQSDPIEFERLQAKAERIIKSAEPPARINDNPGWYECKFCTHYQICHQKRVPNKNCRTCAHSTAITTEDGGKWGCETHKEYISHELQRKGCGDHVFIPALIQYAKPVDAGNGWIAYKHDANGRVFINLAHEAMPPVKFLEENNATLYTSEELTACDPVMIGDPMIDAVKKEFEGAHVVA